MMCLSALNMRSDWFFLGGLIIFDRWFTAVCKDQQESRALAGKPHVRCRCTIRYNIEIYSAATSCCIPAFLIVSCIAVVRYLWRPTAMQ